MVGLSHVILQVGFCRAIARVAPDTTVALRVRTIDRLGKTHLDRIFRFQRGDEPKAVVEFDGEFGIYRLDVESSRYRCAATDYLVFIPDHDRSISETLSDAGQTPAQEPMLLSGTAPQSFLYVQPTFVLFDKSAVACGQPVPQPLSEPVDVENDQDAYYAWLYRNGATGSAPQQLALRLRTPTHQYHYVRIPVNVPAPWTGWPESISLNVTEDMIDGLAGEKTNVLLCPKMWRTSAG